ncbi:endonuclease/exonuclease/phosphatase family protein [Spirosoma daeguense]
MTTFNLFIGSLPPALRHWGNTLKALASYFVNRYREFPVAYTMLSYLFFTMAFCYYPMIDHWLTGFIMMSLPLAMAGGLAASIYLFYRQQSLVATAGLIWVLFSFVVAKRLIGSSDGKLMSLEHSQPLNVLSFNSETFSLNPQGSGFDPAALKADIACFQEYSPNALIERQYESKVEKLRCFDRDRQIGLALFSNYPIVKEYGRIWSRPDGPEINGFLCADIAYKSDTIRVVNVHLWSMGVRTDQLISALKTANVSQFFSAFADIFGRLKEGFENRNEQLAEVESYVVGSRYPVLICGDFNELPIGYSYGKLRQNFQNAFEEAGQGLGFTLNRHPYCARIDQQFVSNHWQIKTCQTLSGISFSDHFPVLAQYVLKPNREF